MSRTTLRNTVIVLALAGVATVWREGLSDLTFGLGQLISVLFVAALVGFGIQYFRERRLAWLVMKPWQRGVVIAAAAVAVALALVGFRLLGDRITDLGVVALIVACVLLIVWLVRESQRYR